MTRPAIFGVLIAVAVMVTACTDSSTPAAAPASVPVDAVHGTAEAATAPSTASGPAPITTSTPTTTTTPAPAIASSTTPTMPQTSPPVVESTTPPTPTSAAPPPTLSAVTTVDPAATACIDALPLSLRAGQVVMAAVYGDQLDSYAEDLHAMNVGGVILMTWPEGTDPSHLAALKATTSPPLMVAVDEEGGNVQRLKALGVYPSEATVAATMTPDAARQMIAAHAVAVHQLGIDIVFAPVVDVAPLAGPGPIGKRSFGQDPATVSAYAAAYVDGWESAGILPVLKHFPGHGSASGDSHTGRVTTPPLDQLAARDLVPYTVLADRHPGVMVGHLDVPGLTDGDDRPASLSPRAINGLLRGQLGYADALVFTDALGMDAISGRWSVAEAAVLSLAAGADVVLYAAFTDTAAVIAAIETAVGDGRLSPARLGQAVAHVFAAKGVDPCTVGK